MKKYPIGISTLEKIRHNNFYYVDKSMFVQKLFDDGAGYYFLSRPRRFGKTLFLDTLKQAFLGNKKVFEGLHLEKHWDWAITYPVIHISYSGNSALSTEVDLQIKLTELLAEHARDHKLTLRGTACSDQFQFLIIDLHEKYHQPVVVLIDEYDKPILDAIEDTERAIKLRDVLKGFYGVMKDLDAQLKFVFLTGVSKFSKAGIFSGLNNLTDLSMNERYADICGITQTELEMVYAEPIQALAKKETLSLDDCLTRIKTWYNGYRFTTADVSVYNPFSTLNLFFEQSFKNYWFQTGTPSFLIKLMLKEKYAFKDLESSRLSIEATNAFDINNIDLTPLLFQTGYLTIKGFETFDYSTDLILGLPNIEVKQSLYSVLMNYLYERSSLPYKEVFINAIRHDNDLSGIEKSFKGLLASLPHHWYTNNKLQHYEGFYCSVIYAFVVGMGLNVTPEDVTNYGRIDFTIKALDKIFIFEFKVIDEDDTDVSALQQIKDKNYAEKYQTSSNMIYLIGVHFSKAERNVVGFEWEKVSGH